MRYFGERNPQITDKQRRPGIKKEKHSVREIQTMITELDETISARIYQKNKKRVYQTSPMPNVKSSSHRMLHEDIRPEDVGRVTYTGEIESMMNRRVM